MHVLLCTMPRGSSPTELLRFAVGSQCLLKQRTHVIVITTQAPQTLIVSLIVRLLNCYLDVAVPKLLCCAVGG